MTNDDETSGEAAPGRSAGGVRVPVDYVPVRRGHVLEMDMGDGLILYNHESNLVHHLNPSAGIVWQLCDGQASVAQMAREVSEECGLDLAQVREDVAAVIAEFEALDMVTGAQQDSATRHGEPYENGGTRG